MLAFTFTTFLAALTALALWLRANSQRKLSEKEQDLDAANHAKEQLELAAAKLRVELASTQDRASKAEAELRKTQDQVEGCFKDEERKAKALKEDLEAQKQQKLQLEQKLKRSQQALSSAQKTTRLTQMAAVLSPLPAGTPGLALSPLPSTPQPQDFQTLLTQARQELQQTQNERNTAEQQVAVLQGTIDDLQSQLTSAESQCQTLQQYVTSHAASLSAMELISSEAQAKAKTELQQLTVRVAGLEGQVAAKEAEIVKALSQAAGLKASLTNVQRQLGQEKGKRAEVAAELVDSEVQVQQLQDSLQQQEQTAAASLIELQDKLQQQEQTAAASLIELQDKLQQQEQTAAEQEAALSELQEQLRQQEQETEVVQADRDQLLEQLVQAQRQNQEARDHFVKELDQAGNDLNIAQMQAEHFNQEVNHLSGTLERHGLAFDDMYRLLTCYKACMSNVQQHGMGLVLSHAAEIEGCMDQLYAQVNTLMHNNQDLYKQVEVLTAERKGLQMVRDAHKDRLAQVEASASEWQHEAQQLTTEVSQYQTDKAALCQVLEDLRAEAADLKQHLEAKGQALEVSELQAAELKQQLAAQGQLLADKEARVVELEGQLGAKGQAVQAADFRTEVLEGEVRQLNEKVADLEEQLAAKGLKLAAAEAQAEGLHNEVQQLTAQVSEMEERVSKSSVVFADLEQQVAQLTAELDTVQAEATELYNDNEALAEQVEVYCGVLAELQRVVQHPDPLGGNDRELHNVPLLELPRRARKPSVASSAGTGADPASRVDEEEGQEHHTQGSEQQHMARHSVESAGTDAGRATADGRRLILRQTRSPRLSLDDSVLQALRVQVPKLKADVAMAEAEANTLRGQMVAVRDQLHGATHDLDTARRLAQDAARDRTLADAECATVTKALETARGELEALRVEHADVCSKYSHLRGDMCMVGMELSTVCTDLSCLLERKSGSAPTQQQPHEGGKVKGLPADTSEASVEGGQEVANADVDGSVISAHIITIGMLVSELTLQHKHTLKHQLDHHQQALQDKEDHLNKQHQQAVVEMAAQLGAQHRHAIQEREEQLSSLVVQNQQAIKEMEEQSKAQMTVHHQALQELANKLSKAEELLLAAESSERSARDELESLVQSGLEFESGNKQLCDEHQVLMNNYQELQLVSESEMERCRELQTEVEQLNEELAQVRQQLTSSETELSAVQQQLNTTQEQLTVVQAQHSKKRQELELQLSRQRNITASFIDRVADRTLGQQALQQQIDVLEQKLHEAELRAAGQGSLGRSDDGDGPFRDDTAVNDVRSSDGSVLVTRVADRMKQVARAHGELIRRTSRSQSPPPSSHPLHTNTTSTPLFTSPRRTTLDTMVEMASPAMSAGGVGSGGGAVAQGAHSAATTNGGSQHLDLQPGADPHYLALHSHYSELLSEFCETENHIRSLMMDSGNSSNMHLQI